MEKKLAVLASSKDRLWRTVGLCDLGRQYRQQDPGANELDVREII